MSIQIQIGAPVTGGTQAPITFVPSEFELSWSWGLQPATALIRWVSSNPNLALLPFSELTITAGARTFYGLTEEWVIVKNATGGSDVAHLFQDSRAQLQYDSVVCRFNRRIHRQVGNEVLKFYEHILPIDALRHIRSYTLAPYTGAEILDFLFNAPTVKWSWTRSYHSALDSPVYDVDFERGSKLGTAVLEVSERCGTTFTLKGGRYRLEWCVKGIGSIPIITQADNIRLGQKLSGHPSRITLIGERSLYQVLDVDLEPDWASGWEAFYDVFELVKDIFNFERTEAVIGDIPQGTRYDGISGDDGNLIGWQLAFARAQVITLAQYALLRDNRRGLHDGEQFRDYNLFSGRSRLHMPASVYIKTILFRAFRVPDGFQFADEYGRQLTTDSVDIVDTSLVEVTHDPGTGIMDYDPTLKATTNGYAIVRGYQLGSDAFRTLKPEHFDFSKWKSYQLIWQQMPFHLDDSGQGYQFLLFDEPIIRTDNLLDIPMIAGVAQDFPVLRAGATITPASVKASLVFAGGPFSYVAGLPSNDEYISDPGLQGQFVVNAGVVIDEIPYADGFTALEKATILAGNLLLRQPVYTSGGCNPPVETAHQLTSVIDRITVTLKPDGSGYTERIDWTAGRQRREFEPERDYDRRQQLLTLLPGEREAREQSNQAKVAALGLRQNPNFVKTLMSAATLLFGNAAPDVVYLEN